MRVLVLDNSVAPTGALLSALAFAEALGSEVSFVFVLPAGSSALELVRRRGFESIELKMVEIGRSWPRLLAYIPMLIVNGLRLRRTLGRERIDVLVANDYYNLLPTMVKLMGWRGRILTIVRLLPNGQQPLLNRAWISAMRFASDRVIAVSKAVAKQLPTDIQVKVLYFPVGRGLETVPFVAPPAGDPHSPVTFLYLANFIQGKGQMHALRALAAVGETRPSAQLRFVGGDMGLAKNAVYRESLVAEVERLGLKNRVEFHGPTDDIVSAIQGADIVLNFSESESFSHTCAEAGLLGRPTIATRCGGPEEIIDDGVTGLLVPPGDLDQMQRAMKQLIAQFELRQEMGLAARERLVGLLSRDAFLVSLAELLRGRSCR